MGSMSLSSLPMQGLPPECLVPALIFGVSLFLLCLVFFLCLVFVSCLILPWSFLFFWSRLLMVRDKDDNKDPGQISAAGQGQGLLNGDPPPHAYPSEESKISAGVLSYDCCLVVLLCLVLSALFYLIWFCLALSSR